MPTIRDAVVRFFDDELGLPAGSVSDDEPLFSSGQLDSFGLLNLATFVEGMLKRKLRTSEMTLANFDSIALVTKFLTPA
jgi:acyl carrier protein